VDIEKDMERRFRRAVKRPRESWGGDGVLRGSVPTPTKTQRKKNRTLLDLGCKKTRRRGEKNGTPIGKFEKYGEESRRRQNDFTVGPYSTESQWSEKTSIRKDKTDTIEEGLRGAHKTTLHSPG